MAWKLHEEHEFTAPATTYDITGLDGDADKIYRFLAYIKNDSDGQCYYQLRPNATTDTATTQMLKGDGSTASGAQRTEPPFSLWALAAGDYMFVDLVICAKSGVKRGGIARITQGAPAVLQVGSFWANTSANITSLRLFAEQTNGIGADSWFLLFKWS